MFTKFSIWEEETVELINNIKRIIPNSGIYNWMHKEGPILGVKLQEEWFAKNADKKITPECMINRVKEDFLAIKSAFLQTIPHENQKEVSDLFDDYIKKAVERHIDFYAIRAEIANDLNRLQKQNPYMSKNEKGMHTFQAYLKYKKSHPSLAGKIDAHIQFMQEFLKNHLTQDNKCDYEKRPLRSRL